MARRRRGDAARGLRPSTRARVMRIAVRARVERRRRRKARGARDASTRRAPDAPIADGARATRVRRVARPPPPRVVVATVRVTLHRSPRVRHETSLFRGLERVRALGRGARRDERLRPPGVESDARVVDVRDPPRERPRGRSARGRAREAANARQGVHGVDARVPAEVEPAARARGEARRRGAPRRGHAREAPRARAPVRVPGVDASARGCETA